LRVTRTMVCLNAVAAIRPSMIRSDTVTDLTLVATGESLNRLQHICTRVARHNDALHPTVVDRAPENTRDRTRGIGFQRIGIACINRTSGAPPRSRGDTGKLRFRRE
jgi:hypothetical protein